MKVYLDNGSTSFPKPKAVADSIYNYLINNGGQSWKGLTMKNH